MKQVLKQGFRFELFRPEKQSPFEKLFEIFQELIVHTSGDVDEAIDWLRQLDQEYELTTPDYTIDDFVEDLKKKGYLREEIEPNGSGEGLQITAKTERMIRQRALDQMFGKLKKSRSGNHKTKALGIGDERTGEFRSYQFGDALDQISMTESIKNAQINHGLGDFSLNESDLIVEQTNFKAQMCTVLMIDISHSMIL